MAYAMAINVLGEKSGMREARWSDGAHEASMNLSRRVLLSESGVLVAPWLLSRPRR